MNISQNYEQTEKFTKKGAVFRNDFLEYLNVNDFYFKLSLLIDLPALELWHFFCSILD